MAFSDPFMGVVISQLTACQCLCYSQCRSTQVFPRSLRKQESPADARVTRDNSKMAAVPRWRSDAILDIIEPEIALFDPPTLNMEWIGCTVCEKFAFKLYCDRETGVRGHSRSSKMALFDRAHTTLYSSSVVTMPLSLTVSEI